MRLNETQNGEVGIFFMVGDRLFSYGDPVRDADSDGSFVNSDMLHIDYWEELKDFFPELRKLEGDYGDWPRGRVLYNIYNDQYIIYLDACYINDSAMKQKILRDFNIRGKDAQNAVFLTDRSHYTCANCDPKDTNFTESFTQYLDRALLEDFYAIHRLDFDDSIIEFWKNKVKTIGLDKPLRLLYSPETNEAVFENKGLFCALYECQKTLPVIGVRFDFPITGGLEINQIKRTNLGFPKYVKPTDIIRRG